MPSQELSCPRCEGYGRVAIVTRKPSQNDQVTYLAFMQNPFPFGEPMGVTFNGARKLFKDTLNKSQGQMSFIDRLSFTKMIVFLNDHLQTCQCPECEGTGVHITLSYDTTG